MPDTVLGSEIRPRLSSLSTGETDTETHQLLTMKSMFWGCKFDPWLCSVGEGSGIAMSYGVGRRCGLDPALLWLWCRPAATAPIQPLAWEAPYTLSAALKRKEKKKICSRNMFVCLFIYLFIYDFLGLYLLHMEVPRLGVKSELQLLAYTTAQQCQIRAASVTYMAAQGNANP